MIRQSSVLVVVILCGVTLSANAESIGTLHVGADVFTDGRTLSYRGTTYEMDSHYFTIGFIVPISIPKVDTHLRLAFGHGDARDAGTSEKYTYISGRNELLLGRKFRLGESQFHVLPQVGFGVQIEAVFREWRDGVGYDSAFVDFVTTLGYSYESFGVGLMGSYQRGVFLSDNNDAGQRVGLSAVIWR